MRRRVNLAAAVLAIVLFVGTAGCSASPSSGEAASAYPERSATVGAVDVKARPVTFDAGGAAITLTFDSHSVSFDADPAAAATLDVDGSRWPASGWDGQPPSGHHREGTVRFTAAGPVRGTATLTIGGGLPQPAQFTWTIGGT